MKKISLFTLFFLILLNIFSLSAFAENEAVDVNITNPDIVLADESFVVDISLTCIGFTSKNACAEIYVPEEFEIVSVNGAELSDKKINWTSAEEKDSFSASITIKSVIDFGGNSKTISLKCIANDSEGKEFTSQTISFEMYMESVDNTLSELKVNGISVNDFSPTKTTYTLSDTDQSSIIIEAKASDSRAVVNGVGTVNLSYGINNVKVDVTAENGIQRTYLLIINRTDTRSSDNTLKTLTTNKEEFIFSAVRTSYNIYVDYETTSIEVSAETNDSKAQIVSGVGKHNLVVGLNTINVIIKAENEEEKTYSIYITRKNIDGETAELSKNNLLSVLEVSYNIPMGEIVARQKIDIGFDGNKLEYTFFVPNHVTELFINAKPANLKASVEIDNINNLQIGKNVIKVRTIGNDSNEYILNVIRHDNSLHTSLNNVIEVLKTTPEKIISLDFSDIDSDETLDYEIFAALNEFDKILKVNKYDNGNIIYTWEFVGGYLPFDKAFDTGVYFDSVDDDKYIKSKDETNGIDVDFAHRGDCGDSVNISLYVGNVFSENKIVNLYRYNETQGKMELVSDNLLVENGYIKFKLDSGDQFYITDQSISRIDWYIWGIILGSSAFIILLFLTRALIKKKKTQYKHNADNELESYDEYADVISPEIDHDEINISIEKNIADHDKNIIQETNIDDVSDDIVDIVMEYKDDETIEKEAKEINELLDNLDDLFGNGKR